MIVTDYPGHLVVIAVVAALAGLTYAAFHAPEVRTPARRPYRWLLMLLQYAVILLLLVITWNPSALQTSKIFTRNTVLALFDTSESMSIADDGRSARLDKAVDTLAKCFRPDDSAGPQYRLYGFDRHAYHCGSTDLLRRWGSETDLHAAFSLVLPYLQPQGSQTSGSDDTGAAGVVLFTDGRVAERDIRSYPVPLRDDVPMLIVGVGSSSPAADIAVKSLSAPTRTWIDTAYSVAVTVAGTDLASAPVTIELLEDDRAIDTREVGRDQLEPSKGSAAGFEATMEFTVPARQLGTHVITARARPSANEVNTANNSRSASVEVTQEQRLQVLLYAQQANFDVGKIRQALAWDKRVDLDLRLDVIRDPVLSQRASADLGYTTFPALRADLYAYDVVLLGPCDFSQLPSAQRDALYGFVCDRGGGLLLLPGPAVASLSAWRSEQADTLLPVILDSRQARLWPPAPGAIALTFEAQDGGLLRPTSSTDPDDVLSPYYNVAQVKPAATTLATIGDTPIVSAHRVGRGRVCLLNASKLFKLYREDRNGGTLAEFISDVIAYLGRTPSAGAGIELFVERTAADPRRAMFSAYVVDQDFQPVNEANVLLTVGEQVVSMQPAGEGHYTAELEQGALESVVATVEAESNGAFLGERTIATSLPPVHDEMSRTDFDEEFLKALARQLGATYLHIDEIDAGVAKTFVPRRQVGSTQQVSSIWPRWPWLMVLFLLLSVKWFTRRSIGLV